MGCLAARLKLGTAAGAIEYAPGPPGETPTNNDNMVQEQQLHAKREPAPAFMVPKMASQSDAGYAQYGDGLYGVGAADANRLLVDRDLRNRLSIQRAFDTNNNLDASFGPEPAMTQPHGSEKAAAAAATFGVGGGMRSGGMSGMTSANSLMGNDGMPQLNAPKMGRGMHLDPRADKPPGMNLQHGIQTASGAYDMSSSAGSPVRRFQGNPL